MNLLITIQQITNKLPKKLQSCWHLLLSTYAENPVEQKLILST